MELGKEHRVSHSKVDTWPLFFLVYVLFVIIRNRTIMERYTIGSLGGVYLVSQL